MALSNNGRIRVNVTGARGALGIDLQGTPTPGQFLVKAPGGGRSFIVASGTGADSGLRQDLAAVSGAQNVGIDTGGSVSQALSGKVNSKQFGVSSSATASQNLQRIQNAINATENGGECVISGTGKIVVDTTLGLLNCLQVTRPMTIRVEANLKSAAGNSQTSRQYMFNVTSPDVTICGGGILEGNGEINDLNINPATSQSYTADEMPGMIHVTAPRFHCSDITFLNAPKLSVLLRGAAASGATFTNVTFRGGPAAYEIGHTAYFGIVATGNSGHMINNCRFMASDSGGRQITGFFAGGINGNSDNNHVIGCMANVYEKLAYLHGSRNMVALNWIEDAIHTDAIRFVGGSHNVALGNCGRNVNGVIQILDGTDNMVLFNDFDGIRQTAVSVQRESASYTSGLHRQIIVGNTFKAQDNTAMDGILVYSEGNDADDIVVVDNKLSGFAVLAGPDGRAAIRLHAVGSAPVINRAVVDRNHIQNSQIGIRFERALRYTASHNKFAFMGNAGYTITTANGAYGTFLGNLGMGGLGGLRGINGFNVATDYANDNRWGDKPLSGLATMTVNTDVVIDHDGIAPNATIFLTGANDLGASRPARAYWDGTTKLVIHAANSSPFAGGEQYRWWALQ